MTTENKKTKNQFQPDKDGKIVGPGTNSTEEKFEGDIEGPSYVHRVNGQPIEWIEDHCNPLKGNFVTYGGTHEDCAIFCGRT